MLVLVLVLVLVRARALTHATERELSLLLLQWMKSTRSGCSENRHLQTRALPPAAVAAVVVAAAAVAFLGAAGSPSPNYSRARYRKRATN